MVQFRAVVSLLTDKRFEERVGTTSTLSRVSEFDIETDLVPDTCAIPLLAVRI